MTEATLQERIRKMCSGLGLAVQHIHDSRRCWLPGWPDLVIFGDGSVLWVELKTQAASLTDDQRWVCEIIRSAGGRWVLWRPSHLLSGEIARTLAELARWP